MSNYNPDDIYKKTLGSKLEIPDDTEQKLADTYQLIRAKEAPKHNRKSGLLLKTAAAVVVLAIGFTALSNSALADTLFGKTFSLLVQSVQGEKTQKDDETLYQSVGEHSQAITASDSQTATDSQMPAPIAAVTTDGSTLNATDYYYDGYNLYLFFTLTTENKDLAKSDWIISESETPASVFTLNGIEVSTEETFCLRKAEDGTFAAVSVIALPETIDVNSGSPVSVRFRPGTLSGRTSEEQELVLNADGSPYLDKDGNRKLVYKELAAITDELKLNFDITLELSQNETFTATCVSGDYAAPTVTRAPGGIYIDFKSNDLSDGHLLPLLYTESGERVTMYNGQSGLYRFVPAKGSSFTLKLMSLQSDEIVAEYRADLK